MNGPGGLTPTELAAAAIELEAALRGATVRDIACLDDRDDLLLFVELPSGAGAGGRRAVHLAPGGRRARITTTRRRFGRAAFATGPRIDRLRELCVDARIDRVEARPGERVGAVTLARDVGGALRLWFELFGPRGLWVLVDGEERILALSRLPEVEDRELRPGARYAPPPPAPTALRAEPAPRFHPPVLDAIDALFTTADRADEARAAITAIERALERARRQATSRLAGAEAQLAAAARADDIRRTADLLLAYGFQAPPGATELRVPDPEHAGAELRLPFDPRKPVHVQAEALYRTARKHADGAEVAARRAAEARAELDRLAGFADRLASAGDDPAGLDELRDAAAAAGLVAPRRPPPVDPARARLQKATGGENYRTFESREGLTILVGRDNRQNDRLTTRVARGNDLWFHVGRGYAGSHVVVRVPKGKTASLDTLLDAGTLAIHFSKVRGAVLEEVIYCHAKDVRKPKGLPPGRVVAARTRSLRVRLEPDRLSRLLGSTPDDRR